MFAHEVRLRSTDEDLDVGAGRLDAFGHAERIAQPVAHVEFETDPVDPLPGNLREQLVAKSLGLGDHVGFEGTIDLAGAGGGDGVGRDSGDELENLRHLRAQGRRHQALHRGDRVEVVDAHVVPGRPGDGRHVGQAVVREKRR
jgi:hypothetical protein